MAKTETIQQPFQYAGQVGIMAEGNNLYYMRARYYDANLGRFISEDPIGHQGGLNLYAYVGGNPIMAVDPSGLVDIRNLAFGLGDFALSTTATIGGIGIALFSPSGGPTAPAVFYGGIGIASYGIVGMGNAGISIRNALYDTTSPGFLEGIGASLAGDSGGKLGKSVDLISQILPGIGAAGTLSGAEDLYNLSSAGNTVLNEFGNGNSASSRPGK